MATTVKFGPQNEDHRRVQWPVELELESIQLSSDFVTLLTHNLPPSDEEWSRIQELEESTQQRLKDFQNTASDGRKRPVKRRRIAANTNVISSQIGLKKQIFTLHIIMSVSRRLPDDIIHEILSHFPEVFTKETNWRQTPYVLAQVSQSWRRIVLGNSKLWTTMSLDCTPFRRTGYQLLLDGVNRLTRLSGTKSVTVHLEENAQNPRKCHPCAIQCVLEWLGTMSPHRIADRIERISVRAPTANALGKAFLVLERDRPFFAVRSYLILGRSEEQSEAANTLDDDEDDDSSDDEPSEDGSDDKSYHAATLIWKVFPNMQRFWLGDLEISATLAQLLNPTSPSLFSGIWGAWRNLTTLYIQHCLPRPAWYLFLKSCPLLQTAWLEIHDDESLGPVVTAVRLTHYHLKTLVVRYYEYAGRILEPFSGLEFPNLCNLDFHFCGSKLRKSTTAVVIPDHLDPSNFTTTFPLVRRVLIHDVQELGTTGIKGLFPLFLALPSTTHLRIFFQLFQQIQRFLNFMEDDSCPLPKLHKLELEFAHTTGLGPWRKEWEPKLISLLLRSRRLWVNPHQYEESENSSNSNDASTSSNSTNIGVISTSIRFGIFPHLPYKKERQSNEQLQSFIPTLKKKLHEQNSPITVETWMVEPEAANWQVYDEPFERKFRELYF